jgi:methionine-R-sulfoxide reductase
MTNQYNQLTSREKQVILDKATEPPFSGEYDNFYKTGTYLCRQCNQQLFASDTKFDAQCGWPSFDKALPNAIIKINSDDGQTEVICSNCRGHLGHLFEGENLTASNNRYCINSLSLKFIPSKK